MIMREIVHLVSFKVNESSVAAVEGAAKGLGHKLQALMGIAAVGVGFFEMGKHMLYAAQSLQKLNIMITAYSNSKEQAAHVSAEFRKLGESMPTIEVDKMHEAISALLNRGIKIGDVVETFRQFKTITSATGGDVNKMVNAFAETMSSGVLTKRYINSFIMGAKVPINQILSDFTGKSVKEITALGHAGKISALMVSQALAFASGQGSKYFNILEMREKSIAGMFQLLKNKLFYAEAGFGEKLWVPVKMLVEWASKALGLIDALSSGVKRFIVVFGIVEAMALAAIGILLLFSMIAPEIVAIGVGLTLLSAIIGEIINDIYNWSHGHKSILGRLLGDFEKYKPVLREISAQFSLLWAEVKKDVRDAKEVVNDLLNSLTGMDLSSAFFKGLRVMLWLVKETLAATKDLIELSKILFGYQKPETGQEYGAEGTKQQSLANSINANRIQALNPQMIEDLRSYGDSIKAQQTSPLFALPALANKSAASGTTYAPNITTGPTNITVSTDHKHLVQDFERAANKVQDELVQKIRQQYGLLFSGAR